MPILNYTVKEQADPVIYSMLFNELLQVGTNTSLLQKSYEKALLLANLLFLKAEPQLSLPTWKSQ